MEEACHGTRGTTDKHKHKHKRLAQTNRAAIKHTPTHHSSSTSAAVSTWPTMAPMPVLHLGQARSLTSPHSKHGENHATNNRREHRKVSNGTVGSQVMPRGKATKQSVARQPHMEEARHGTRGTTHTHEHNYKRLAQPTGRRSNKLPLTISM